MRMHVKNKSKRIAISGVMAALSTVLMVLGTVISVNTVFFTSAAAFLAGMAVLLYGGTYGILFYAVCGGLDFLFNPNKLHIILYLVLAGYIVISEVLWMCMKRMADGRKKEWIHRGIRFVLFVVLYVPLIYFIPELLVSSDLVKKQWFMPGALLFGIIAWVLFDLAYGACKKIVWIHLKKISRKE